MRDEHYVYHAPSEPAPRAIASGDQNIVGLGAMIVNRWDENGDVAMLPVQQQPGPQRLPIRVCPAWGCNPPGGGITPTYVLRTPAIFPYPGATNTVPQPPPSAGGSQLVPVTQPLPVSPTPSPTVAVSSTQTAPQLTQPGAVLDSTGATISTASDIGTWLGESTLISGIPNWGLAAAAVFGAMMLFGGKAGRR